MEAVAGLFIGAQLVFMLMAIIYFIKRHAPQIGARRSTKLNTKGELARLKSMRQTALTEPMTEKTRPESLSEIVGQEKGVRALMAAICGPNPQHVIMYGPPGVGKTAAARLLLDHARMSPLSPFQADAPFVEVDATILRYDERGIADPLIGSVHDPIYQGAGVYGTVGIPKPQPGAVTQAHGGILFLDEIGELSAAQMNKLLKVLEDRRVFLTSTYYSPSNPQIPKHIHDIFKNGFPADFRLIGATTRNPDELPAALRSRCTQIFFKPLTQSDVSLIARNTCKKAGFNADAQIFDILPAYSTNGRDTVNILQTAASFALLDRRRLITVNDLEETLEQNHCTPRPLNRISSSKRIGVVNGLVISNTQGALIEIEATVLPTHNGKLLISGIIEQEELSTRQGKLIRTSTIKNSVNNALTVLSNMYGINTSDYDIHINIPGGSPIDGPSAGITIFCALFSALTDTPISSKIAMTGELTITGRIAPVGGVSSKIEAAAAATIEHVLIPSQNYQASFALSSLSVTCVDTVKQITATLFHSPNLPPEF